MGNRSSFDPQGSPDLMIDQNIGNAYRHVANVSRHMAEVIRVSNSLVEGGGGVVTPPKDGVDGKDGIDGKDGTNGKDGAAGRGIVSALLNSASHLIISYTDNTTQDAGLVGGGTVTPTPGPTPTPTPTPSAPVNKSLPGITGNTASGSTLSCSNGLWDNSPTAFTYQWYRDDVIISGSVNSTRLLTANDVGKKMKCTVIATNASGSTPVDTAATAAVTGSAMPIPVNTALPVISGNNAVGETLNTTNGTWTNNPTAYSYQWRRNGVDIVDGANKSSYVQVNADVGKTLTVRVTAANDGGSTPAVAVNTNVVPTPTLFSAQSPWNSYVENPVFGTDVVPASKNLPWIEESAYSSKTFYASSADGPMTIYGTDGNASIDIAGQLEAGTVTIPHFPTATEPAVGLDGHAEIVDMTDGTVHSFYAMYKSNGQWRTAKYTRTTYSGRGFGTVSQPDNSRAAGTSTIGGLLLKDELGMDIVPHALAIGMDRNAFQSGPVYPATLEDYTGWSNYGNIPGSRFPMGSLLMIPADFDVNTLVLPESKTIARTMKKFGGYLVDATNDTMNFYAEIGSGWNKSFVNGKYDNNFNTDMQKIKAAMRRVMSFSAIRDRNNQVYTPVQLKDMNLVSMRGPWQMEYNFLDVGGFNAARDFYEIPATTEPFTKRQLLYTYDETAPDRFFKWKGQQTWHTNPIPGQKYRLTAIGAGPVTVNMQVKKGAFDGNYFSSPSLAPGQSADITWPNDTYTVAVVYVDKAPGDEASIRLEMTRIPA